MDLTVFKCGLNITLCGANVALKKATLVSNLALSTNKKGVSIFAKLVVINADFSINIVFLINIVHVPYTHSTELPAW